MSIDDVLTDQHGERALIQDVVQSVVVILCSVRLSCWQDKITIGRSETSFSAAGLRVSRALIFSLILPILIRASFVH